MKAVLNLSKFFASHPLTRDARIKAWTRFALWQIKSHFQKEISVPWIAGQRLLVRRGMSGATGNIYAGLHEFADMMFLLHFLRSKDLFLDIGANVGSFTVLASGVNRADTIAFEPDQDTARALRRNVAVNGLEGRVTVHEVALGPSQGEISFTKGLGTMNRVSAADEGGSGKVQQEMLDTVIGDANPIMIKMDVEGYEEQVLSGAQRVLAKECLKAIEIETVTPRVNDLLLAKGFERAYYDPFRRALAKEPIGAPASNALYIKDLLFVAKRVESAVKIGVLGYEI